VFFKESDPDPEPRYRYMPNQTQNQKRQVLEKENGFLISFTCESGNTTETMTIIFIF
jgi:hypothetical protein